MANCSDNYIFNMTENMEALGGWVSVGYFGAILSFILLCLYMCNVFIFIMKYPSWARRHQAWITSLPMVISFLSLSSFFVPRAAIMCEAVKFIYMLFIMVQFVETTLVIGGGEKVLLGDLIRQNAQWYWLTLPFGIKQFFPFPLTKYSLRWIVGLIYQALISQLVLTVAMAVLEFAEVLQRDTGDATFCSFLILNMVSFTVGLFFFNVLIVGLSSYLDLEKKWPMFMWKYYALLSFIGFQKAQTFLIGIFTFTNYESPILTWKTIDAAASMLEAFIFGILFFFFFKVIIVKQDKGNTQKEPFLPPQHEANNELVVQTVF